MRRKDNVLWCLLALLCSCNSQGFLRGKLAEADRIIESDADSALHILQHIGNTEELDNDTRAYYYLLSAQAKYKLYQPVPPDSILHAVTKHYAATNNNSMLCRALYYRAMPLYEKGRHDEALRLLKDGERMAVGLHDTLYKAKYHESLCMINYMARCDDLMLLYAKQFLQDAIRLGDSLYIARAYSHVSTAYTRLGYADSAAIFIRQTLPYLGKMSKKSKAYILTNIGCTFHKNGDLASACSYLEQSLREHPMANTYAELGDVCADKRLWGQAEEYWSKAMKTDDTGIIVNVLSSRLSRLRQQGASNEAFAIMERMYRLRDSLQHASEQAKITEIQYKYDRQVVENRLYKTLTWTFFGAFFALLFIILLVYYHRRKVKMYVSRLDESRRTIQESLRRIELLESSGQEHNKEIDALKKRISDSHQKAYEQLGRGKEVYESVCDNRPLLRRDDERCLIDYYSILRYQTFHQWMQDYKGLSSRLITYLILQDMGKTDEEIAVVLSVSSSSVRSIKSRLKAKKVVGGD